MMAQKCVHKGCGKVFSDSEDPCVYHPGPPVFHEGQKGWQCCKPRVLTFDEFLAIPPCTTGKHSTVDDTPAPPPKPQLDETLAPPPKPISEAAIQAISTPAAPQPAAPLVSNPEPESEEDDPSLPIPPDTACRRRGCGQRSSATTGSSREGEQCVHHPGHPIFHEGTKGWSCCKKRVLEFDEFMKIEGCAKKPQHMFVGSGRKGKGEASGEKQLETVRHDFYQTGAQVHASYYLKKIDKASAVVEFKAPNTVELDLPTADKTRYKASIQLFGGIDPDKSKYKIMGTKLDLDLAKADGASWPVLQADDPRTGEIIQTGSAGRA